MKLIAILTPTKTLTTKRFRQHRWRRRWIGTSKKLIALKKMSQSRLKGLLKVSDKIAALNYERYQNYEKNEADRVFNV